MPYPDDIPADFSARHINSDIDPVLGRRWSPRAFKKVALAEQDVQTLCEAARVAPSCFNEQPWRFYLSGPDNFAEFLSLLVPANQRWAQHAALLGFIAAKNTFSYNGKPNPYAAFDCGAAWMSLTVQARAMGLYTHGMGGIAHDKVKARFDIGDDFTVLCGFAVGVADHAETLPQDLAAKETPTPRKALSEIVRRG